MTKEIKKDKIMNKIKTTDKKMKDYMCSNHKKGTLMAAGVGMALGAGIATAAIMKKN